MMLSINSKYAALKKNIVPCNIGLSDDNTKLPFIIAPNNNIGGSRIISIDNKIKSNNKTIYVNVKPADEISVLKEESISLIKIDIEGHEINALKGAENIIRSNKPVILFEQTANEIHNSSSEVIDYLSSLNYSFYIIQSRFYHGERFIYRFFGTVLSSLFGGQLSFVKKKYFDKHFYDMILAIRNNKL